MTPRRKRWLRVAVPTITTVAILELGLQGFALLCPKEFDLLMGRAEVAVKDERLGQRGDPNFPGHDQRGFRNEALPKQAFIVAMGDSQTYGYAVSREQTWPHCLGSLCHRSVYNMGLPGRGPTHSLLLFSDAMALQTKLIVEAFNPGNDHYGC